MPSYTRSDWMGQQFIKPSSFKAFQNKQITLKPFMFVIL